MHHTELTERVEWIPVLDNMECSSDHGPAPWPFMCEKEINYLHLSHFFSLKVFLTHTVNVTLKKAFGQNMKSWTIVSSSSLIWVICSYVSAHFHVLCPGPPWGLSPCGAHWLGLWSTHDTLLPACLVLALHHETSMSLRATPSPGLRGEDTWAQVRCLLK